MRRKRLALGLTQADLAERTGLARTTISEVEMGHREPHRLTATRIRAALDLPVGGGPPGDDRRVEVTLQVVAELVAKIDPTVLVDHVLPVLDGFVNHAPVAEPRWRLVLERAQGDEP